ncbi:MAG: extracellular solute-binding protein [Patescibacteria group bacterium]
MSRFLYIAAGIAGVLLLILIIAVAGFGRKDAEPEPATLEFWGVSDDAEVWRDVIALFRQDYPHILVNYKRFPADTYEETLVNRLAEGKGPDLFLLPDTWLVKHRDKIFPLPKASNPLSAADLKRTFVDDPATRLLTPEGDLLGLPMFVDSLALFYNKDIFDGAGIAQPPADWDAVAELSHRLARVSPEGDITRAGMALGSAKNVDHAFEIISALILQRGNTIVRANKSIDLDDRASAAFALFSSFADSRHKNYTWTSRMPASLDAFAAGQAAMAIGFAEDVPAIRAKNPHLALGVAPLPRFSGDASGRTLARYFFPVVSRLSKNGSAAWQFIFYITGKEASAAYYKESGRPPARRDLIFAGAGNEIDDVFFRASLAARSWPMSDEDASRGVFTETLDAIAARTLTPSQAVGWLSSRLFQIMP